MSFKSFLSDNVTLLFSGLFLSMSIFMLWIDDSLTLYIHPRYELFTLILVLFGGSTLLFQLFQTKSSKIKISYSAIMTFVFCAAILLLPTQILSSRAALNREQSSYTFEEVITTSYDQFSNDYSNLTISEWSSLLSKRPPIEQIRDKTAVLEGFALYDDDAVSIARFRIACCSVDATPLRIQISDTAVSQLSANEWYRVTGTFEIQNGMYVLIPTDITPIEEPGNPYVF